MQISVFYMLKMDKHTKKCKEEKTVLICYSVLLPSQKEQSVCSPAAQRHSSCLAIFFVLPAKGAFVAKVILCVTLGYFVERAKAPVQRA